MNRPFVLIVAILPMIALNGLPAGAEDKSVAPGINQPFQNPDIGEFQGKFEKEGREAFDHRDEIVKACEIKPGMSVADVGAGTGLFTRAFAKAVGEEGKVYAVDIAENFVRHIQDVARKNNLRNIEAIVCKPDDVGLPAASVDLVFICDTYHHFEFPQKTMASIHKALKPGGRVVVIDYQRVPGKSTEWVLSHVRAGQEVFEREIVESGFQRVRQVEGLLKENYMLVFEKAANNK